MNMIVTTKQIATALGISSVAVLSRARKHSWPVTGIKTQGGGGVYILESLPLSAKDKRVIRSKMLAILHRNSQLMDSLSLLEENKKELLSQYKNGVEPLNKKIRKLKKLLKTSAIIETQEQR